MEIEYKFVTGEKIHIEVYGKFEEIMLELDKNLKNNDRKETRRHESLSEVEKSPNNTDESSDVYEEVLKKLDKDKLYSAIAKLKPSEQELIYKLYLDKKPIAQVEYAQILGITENAVQLRLAKIKKKLKSLMRS